MNYFMGKKQTWTDDSLKKIFLNNLRLSDNIKLNQYDPETITIDKGRINNYGYRDDDFTKLADILMVGCSMTFGQGLEEKYIWPNYIKKWSNKECANLSVNGGSIIGLIYRIFAYIRKFGNPEIILCLWPDINRVYLPLIPGRFEDLGIPYSDFYCYTNKEVKPFLTDICYANFISNDSESWQPQYSKLPHSVSDVLPIEFVHFYTIQQIHLLEQYCFVSGIKLYWGTWSTLSTAFFNKIKSMSDPTYFRYYINDLDEANIYSKISKKNKIVNFSCHQNLQQKDNKTYNIAADNQHFGSHSQIHIAEKFFDLIKDDLNP
jgi:hypothetical protein